MSEANARRYAPDLMAGQVALVTGSGSGMGRATALEMASCGARLALFARRQEPLEETAGMIRAAGGEAFVVPGDTRDEDSIEAAMARIKDHYGRLDVLVNNAGGPVHRCRARALPSCFQPVAKMLRWALSGCHLGGMVLPEGEGIRSGMAV
jgi:NAD(P)-dependent dehydrogenase (short-subunit alcohol dehydrogenase family)